MNTTKKHWLEKTGWWKHLQALGERSLDEFLGAIKRREEQSREEGREEGFVSGYNYGLSHKEGMRCCIHCSNKTSLREELRDKIKRMMNETEMREMEGIAYSDGFHNALRHILSFLTP